MLDNGAAKNHVDKEKKKRLVVRERESLVGSFCTEKHGIFVSSSGAALILYSSLAAYKRCQ